MTPAIDAMLQTIESDMAENGVNPCNLMHQAYITAKIELENNPEPNSRLIHNILANALAQPKITKH